MVALQQDVTCRNVEFKPRIAIHFMTNDVKQSNSTLDVTTIPHSRQQVIISTEWIDSVQFYTISSKIRNGMAS
jgi:hypothetical protein